MRLPPLHPQIPLATFLDPLLPQTCVACHIQIPGNGKLACQRCDLTIRAAMDRAYCPRCGRTLPSTAIHDRYCARCRTERNWNVDGITRVALYIEPLRRIMLDLKYAGIERCAEYLAELLADKLREQPWHAELDALVPVPMHWLRRLQRRCNHARVMTQALARRIRTPMRECTCRVRYRPSQMGIASRTARFENVADSFGPRRWPPVDLTGQTVCIVDNLLLTGATIYEVAKTLRKRGAKRIYAAVVARPAGPADPPTLASDRYVESLAPAGAGDPNAQLVGRG